MKFLGKRLYGGANVTDWFTKIFPAMGSDNDQVFFAGKNVLFP
jgi:hypothetical protein